MDPKALESFQPVTEDQLAISLKPCDWGCCDWGCGGVRMRPARQQGIEVSDG